MPQVTNTAEFPVQRKEAFEYLTNPENWPNFYANLTGLVGHERAWARKGDEVTFHYNVLGRKLAATATLDEFVYGEKVRHTAVVPGVGEVHQEWAYRDTPSGVAVEVTMNTQEQESFFGKAIDRYIIPRALQRDLDRTLENMAEMFSIGIPAS